MINNPRGQTIIALYILVIVHLRTYIIFVDIWFCNFDTSESPVNMRRDYLFTLICTHTRKIGSRCRRFMASEAAILTAAAAAALTIYLYTGGWIMCTWKRAHRLCLPPGRTPLVHFMHFCIVCISENILYLCLYLVFALWECGREHCICRCRFPPEIFVSYWVHNHTVV
jgi:hypothetical protein